MVVDASALFAILLDEPEKQRFVEAIDSASIRLIGAPTAVEIAIIALGRQGEPGLADMLALTSRLGLETAAFESRHAILATDAFRRFGKGRHPAALNFGDCCAYALSKATGEPLLFKGDDFARTDVTPAV